VKPYYDHGGITIYHADCRSLLTDLSYDVLITDPPYGVSLGKHAGADKCRAGFLVKRGGYDDTPQHFSDVVVPSLTTAISAAKRAMVFLVPPSAWQLPPPDAIGGVFIAGAVGRNRWGWSNLIHCLLYGTAPGLEKGAKPTAINKTATAEVTGHPTTKPLPWMRWAVGLGSADGETIIDPFMGSGTTLRAAKDLGRRAIGIEIDERYCEIAAKRLSQDVLPGIGWDADRSASAKE
jgi:site-specific DNA-methyltransferase (adenine-specific)